MIIGLFLVLTGLVVLSALVHSRFLAKEVARLQAAATEALPEANDDDLSDRDFALSWYRVGVDKGWDMKSKDVLVTDLTVEQAFDDEWDSLDDQEADG